MGRKRNSLPDFIDGKRYFLRHGRYRDGSEIVYKRLSDGETSLGSVRWFEKEKSGKISITVIDNILHNYQTCYIEDIIEKVDQKTRKKLVSKMNKP